MKLWPAMLFAAERTSAVVFGAVVLLLLLLLQARVALVGADAAQAALSKLDAELAPPPGYADSRTTSGNTSSAPIDSTGHTATGTGVSQGRAGTASQRRGDHAQEANLAQGLQRHVADVSVCATGDQEGWHCQIQEVGCVQLSHRTQLQSEL